MAVCHRRALGRRRLVGDRDTVRRPRLLRLGARARCGGAPALRVLAPRRRGAHDRRLAVALLAFRHVRVDPRGARRDPLHPYCRSARPLELGRARNGRAADRLGALHAQVDVGDGADPRRDGTFVAGLGAAARLHGHRPSVACARLDARPAPARRRVETSKPQVACRHARGARLARRVGRACGLARLRPLPVRMRDHRVSRIAPRVTALGCAAPGNRQAHAALVRGRERVGRDRDPLRRLVARLAARCRDRRERGPDRPLCRPRAAARARPGPGVVAPARSCGPARVRARPLRDRLGVLHRRGTRRRAA